MFYQKNIFSTKYRSHFTTYFRWPSYQSQIVMTNPSGWRRKKSMKIRTARIGLWEYDVFSHTTLLLRSSGCPSSYLLINWSSKSRCFELPGRWAGCQTKVFPLLRCFKPNSDVTGKSQLLKMSPPSFKVRWLWIIYWKMRKIHSHEAKLAQES